MQWIAEHFPLILAIAYGVVSEALAIVQILKYPTNSGVGGILAAVLKVLGSLGVKTPPAA